MKIQFLFIIFPLLIFCSCNSSSNNNINGYMLTFDRETFDLERQLWQEQNIQNYSFLQVHGLRGRGHIPTTIIVENGVFSYYIIDYGPDEGTHPVPDDFKAELVFRSYKASISTLYELIDELASDLINISPLEKPVKIDMLYDDTWHYPKYFKYDHTEGYSAVEISDFIVYQDSDSIIPQKQSY